MGERQITIQTVPASEARQKFGELLKRVYHRQVRVIVEKGGIPVAALVSLVDLERWMSTEQEEQATEPSRKSSKEVKPMAKEAIVGQPPTQEELARRQALVAKILELREECTIAPLTTTDLIHQVRKEREEAYERWTS